MRRILFSLAVFAFGISGAAGQAPPFNSSSISTLGGNCGASGALPVQTSGAATVCIAPGTNGFALEMVGGVPTWASVSGTGTVTSAGMTVPSFLSVTGSPITTAGTFALSLSSQSANTVFSSPNGSAGAPTFRQLVAGDIVTGTSGAAIPLLSTANTWSLTQTFSALPVLPSQSANLHYASPDGSAGAPSFRAITIGDLPTISVAKGGTNSTSASGAALDNISGFASTGVVQRTGAGAYSFLTVGSGASNLVQLDASSKLPAVDGSALTNLPSAVLPQFLGGCTLSFASVTTFGVSACAATSEDGSLKFMKVSSAFTKSLSAFALGTANGSLDTGSVAASTWYHVHEIMRTDGTVDYLLSLSAVSPTMPAIGGTWSYRRRIGSIKTNASSQIVPFAQIGDRYSLNDPILEFAGNAAATTAITRTLACAPTGVVVSANLSAMISPASVNATSVYISPLYATDAAPAAFASPLASGYISVTDGNAYGVWNSMTVDTNTSAQIRTRNSTTTDPLNIVCYGWIDNRGK